MAFEPDIIVRSTDGEPLLVIEAKLGPAVDSRSEEQLAHYMFGMQFSAGVIATPRIVRTYRNTYGEPGSRSIVAVAEFSAPLRWAREIAGAPTRSRAVTFEKAVQRWFEELARGAGVEDVDEKAKSALEEHVLPLLNRGEVRAAHPRVDPTSA